MKKYILIVIVMLIMLGAGFLGGCAFTIDKQKPVVINNHYVKIDFCGYWFNYYCE